MNSQRQENGGLLSAILGPVRLVFCGMGCLSVGLAIVVLYCGFYWGLPGLAWGTAWLLAKAFGDPGLLGLALFLIPLYLLCLPPLVVVLYRKAKRKKEERAWRRKQEENRKGTEAKSSGAVIYLPAGKDDRTSD